MTDIQDIDRLVMSTGPAITVFLLDKPDPATRQTMLDLFGRMQAAMPWGPQNLQTVAANIWDRYQRFSTPTIKPPPQATTAAQQQAWQTAARGWQSFNAGVYSRQLAMAKAEGQRLSANVDFWQRVSDYSGTTAVTKAWDDLWAAVESFKRSREAAAKTLAESARVLSAMGAKAPGNLRSAQASLESQVSTLTNQAKNTLAPLGPAAQANAGLGLAPLVIGAIAVGSVVAITAGIVAITSQMAAVQRQANDHAHAVLTAREKADQAAFEAGQISNQQLVERRRDNVEAAERIADSQGAGAIGGALGKAGMGTFLAVGSLALLAIGGIYIFNRARSAKSASDSAPAPAAVATNPRRRRLCRA
jgi:hypothetical protein